MKKFIMLTIATILLFVGGSFINSHAVENPANDGELKVPWIEFKKLLNLDEDEIMLSIDSFQKILEQTGTKITPPHSIKEGNVVLKRTEFKILISQMKSTGKSDKEPPFDYLITKAVYAGKMGKENTTFTGKFNIHVLKKDAYVNIPVLPQSVALSDIKINGKSALIVSDKGYHNLIIDKEGEYQVSATFTLKSSLKKGPHKIDLYIMKTPITLLNLEMPLSSIDVEIPQAQQIITKTTATSTIVSAVIAQSKSISIRWRKKTVLAEKLPPKIYASVNHLVSIEDSAIKMNSVVNYNILHSEVDSVQVTLPGDMNVLTVSGEGVGEWQETKNKQERILIVPFTYGKKGNVAVRISTETAYSEKGMIKALSGLRTLNTVRETGFIGISLNTSAEVIATDIEGLEEVSIPKLPRPLIHMSAKPLIMGFKYLKHPYHLALDIKKHEKIEVPVAAINSASVVTLFTEDGKVVHRLVYKVRNSAKQFLGVFLPENADVWSVFVGNQPVESSMNAEGKLLVPLIRSRSVNNQLDEFPVEIIYCIVNDRFSMVGSQDSTLPAVDLLISQLIWSVYLPNDYSYIYFKSTLEKEDIIRGINVFGGLKRQYDETVMQDISKSGEWKEDTIKKAYKGKDYRSQFRNVPMKEDQIASQVDNELGFSQRLEGLAKQEAPRAAISRASSGTGLMPIQIQVPTGGQVYRFARTIIKTDDPLSFSVVYTRLWTVNALKWMLFIIILFIIYIGRKRVSRIGKWVETKSQGIKNYWQRNESTIKRGAQSTMTPFILLGLIVLFWSISKGLASLFIFLMWISIVYQIIQYRKKRKTNVKIEEKRKTQIDPS